MINSIECHEDVLKNQERSLKRLKETIESLQNNYADDLERYKFRRLQIKEAKKFGKDGFDSDRFMKNRKGKIEGKK